MAILSDYTSGLISLANGSVTVTGTGTMFKTVGLKAGATLLIQNLTAVIVSVDSNTKLTLAEPWTGTSLVNAPYRARFLPDGTTVTATTATLIEMLGNGNLEALAGLIGEMNKVPMFTGAGTLTLIDKSEFVTPDPNGNLVALAELASRADMLPYFTGAGTAGLTPLTAFARTLLDDSDARTALATLGFSIFMRDQANANSFAGWGLNNANSAVPNDNLNILRINGVYRIASTTVGAPNDSINQVLHMGQAQNYAVQIAFPLTTNITRYPPMRRTLVNNVWSDWAPLASESGSNANGYFVRFADGTQICWATVSLDYVQSNRLETTWTFPASFISGSDTRVGQVTLPYQTANYVGVSYTSAMNPVFNTGDGKVAVWGAGFAAGNKINNIQVMVIGRWF